MPDPVTFNFVLYSHVLLTSLVDVGVQLLLCQHKVLEFEVQFFVFLLHCIKARFEEARKSSDTV